MESALSPLEGVDNSSRVLRTSIFLKNSLNQSQGDIRDLLDCVVPIVSESINQMSAGQIDLVELQDVVKQRFSFKMPAFTLEHVLGRLAQQGKIRYEHDQKSYYHDGPIGSYSIEESETVSEKIAFLESDFEEFAVNHFQISEPPFFKAWADVLVFFLHPDAAEATGKVKNVKGALLSDFDEIIRRIASNYILHCERREDKNAFNIAIEIYGGILLGDFLQNIQTTGSRESFNNLTVFYDTAILLRLLGCSGAELRNANMEMHRDLQALGCKTEFLEHIEGEVANILDTIVNRHDSHLPIFGETGEALLDGSSDLHIGALRELQNGYPEALAALNIFPCKYTFQNTKTQNYFQIDEIKFQETLAAGTSKGYSEQNRIHDTQSLAVVMRLRQSSRSHDLGSARFVFVTANTHLARTARKFVRNELGYTTRYVPPILTHSQISTAAWISNESKIRDSFISRELIANCMSAQKVSKEWVDGFQEFMKTAVINDDDKTLLHAVRSISRDESLGNPTILRKLNPNEILKMAKIAEEARARKIKAEYDEKIEKESQEIRLAAEESKRIAVNETRNQALKKNVAKSEALADKIVRFFEFIFVLISIYVLVMGIGEFSPLNYQTWFQPVAFILVAVLAALDLFQFQPVKRLTTPIRAKLAKIIYRTLFDHTETVAPNDH